MQTKNSNEFNELIQLSFRDILKKESGKIRILVLGSGFGGMSFVKSLGKKVASSKINGTVETILVTRRAYHLFTPLLYQVSSGLVNEYHILDPIRNRDYNYKVIEAEILDLDLPNNKVITDVGEIEYDYLIIALGSVSNDFGIKGVNEYAISLKTPQDAVKIRNKILDSFEKANLLENRNPLRRALLTFVIVGGGATGVELAGTIRDYVKMICKKYYNIEFNETKVILLEATNRLLPMASEKLSKKCKEDLEKCGIKIMLNAKVLSVEKDGILLSNGERIETFNVFWTAGVKPNPIIEKLPEELVPKKKGKIIVKEDLRLIGFSNVFAIGDCAYIVDYKTNKIVPALAASAVQEGKYLSKILIDEINGKKEHKPFTYKDLGLMLSLGRFSGLVEFPNGIIISGFFGWLIWRMVHLVKISTMRNRIGVMFDWTMSLLKRRIITRSD
ncbi:MAG: NAD(P)/FAD-dependent oxidoreductase [Thermoproteota archaeon]